MWEKLQTIWKNDPSKHKPSLLRVTYHGGQLLVVLTSIVSILDFVSCCILVTVHFDIVIYILLRWNVMTTGSFEDPALIIAPGISWHVKVCSLTIRVLFTVAEAVSQNVATHELSAILTSNPRQFDKWWTLWICKKGSQIHLLIYLFIVLIFELHWKSLWPSCDCILTYIYYKHCFWYYYNSSRYKTTHDPIPL